MADEQFGKFVEVIRKLYVNIPLLVAMQVLAFLMPDRTHILQAHRITAVALHLGVFYGIVFFLREALWQRVSKNQMINFTRDINRLT